MNLKTTPISAVLLSLLLHSGCGFQATVGDIAEEYKAADAPKGCSPREGCVKLVWEPVTTSDIGTPLEITGYKVYWGLASRTYSNMLDVGKQTTATLTDLSAGTYYFSVTAYAQQLESGFSDEVTTATELPAAGEVSIRVR